jgi:hypothetical protein
MTVKMGRMLKKNGAKVILSFALFYTLRVVYLARHLGVMRSALFFFFLFLFWPEVHLLNITLRGVMLFASFLFFSLLIPKVSI